MKKILLIFVFHFMFNSLIFAQIGDKELKDLAGNIEEQLKISGLKKIAILEFSNPKKDLSNLGSYIKDNLYSIFSESKNIEIMLDRNVNQLLLEQKIEKDTLLVSDGRLIIDILGVDAIVWGVLTDFKDKLKINTKVVGKKGKLISAYSTDIIKNKDNIIILEGIVKGEQASSQPGRIFLNENFKAFEPDSIPKDWGQGLIVRQNGEGINYISSNIIGERELNRKIEFPENFVFSFNFMPISKDGKLDCSLIFVDEEKENFIAKFGDTRDSDYVIFPDSQKMTVYFLGNKMNNIKIEKKRDIYKFYINNEKIVSGIYTHFRNFKKVILRADFSQGRFTDFQGIDLGR